MYAPKRIWWARPRKLCALERPGGGRRSHRPDRRAAEIVARTPESSSIAASVTLDMLTSHDIARAVEKEVEFPGQIKVTVIRESRSTEYAR
jgi:HD superfamily phosphodiesterase